MERSERRRLNILSIDGGVSGLPALLFLVQMFHRLNFDSSLGEGLLPSQIFDVITGTGLGAIDALLLGRLHLTPAEAVDAYMKLDPSLSVQPTDSEDERKMNTMNFEIAFSAVLVDAGFNATDLMQAEVETKDETKTVICALNAKNVSELSLIRSYTVRETIGGSCTILQAACAAVSSSDKFLPVTIGLEHKEVTLVDAMTGYANPAKVSLREAQRAFGENVEVATIISIGAGKMDTCHFSGGHNPQTLLKALKQITSNCEQVHNELHATLQGTFIYYRFNPERRKSAETDLSINDCVSAYLNEEETNTRCDQGVKSLQARATGVPLKDMNTIKVMEIALKPRPSLVSNFVGREGILQGLEKAHVTHRSPHLTTPVISVLSGLGGAGKTQTALKFIALFEARYPNVRVYFLDASSKEKLIADYETIIRSRGHAYRSGSCDDALNWLTNELKDWFLIVDNADDPSMLLFPFIPKCTSGNVIITTRNATCAGLAPTNYHVIGALPASDSVKLLLEASSYEASEENQAYAQQITSELGHLPLAVSHAAGYILVHRCLSTYLDMYQTSHAKLLASIPRHLPTDYRLSVRATIQMSLDRLSQQACDVLVLFARLDAVSVAQGIIAKAAVRRFHYVQYLAESGSEPAPETTQHANALTTLFCPKAEWIDAEFNDVVQECMHFSLLQVSTQGNIRFYSMHVLVQDYLRSSTEVERHRTMGQRATRLLASAITVDNAHEHMVFHRLLVPHIKLVNIEDVMEPGDLYGFGYVLTQAGEDKLAKLHLERCLRTWEQLLGDNHYLTTYPLNDLIYISCDTQPSEVLKIRQKIWHIRQTSLGDEHPATMVALYGLAVAYTKSQNYKEAVKLYKKTLEMERRVLGEEHRSNLITMSNLASTYVLMHQLQDAAKLQEKVLEMTKGMLGEEDLDTARSRAALAHTYREMGRHHEALKLQEKAFKTSREVQGKEHLDTLDIMSSLAMTYAGMDRYHQAIELFEEVLKLRTKLSGDGDRDTLLVIRVTLIMWKMKLPESNLSELVQDLDPAELQCLQQLLEKFSKTLTDSKLKFSWFAPRIFFLILLLAAIYRTCFA